MVLIEPVPSTSEEKTLEVEEKPSRPDPPAAVDLADDKSTPASGYASDGFETASETEVNDDNGDENDDEALNKSNTKSSNSDNPDQQQHLESHKEQSTDQSADDELKQKALTQANDAKIEGNKLFGDGRYEEALLRYDSALQIAPDIPASAELRSICHSNRATCFFKLAKYEDAIKECTKALELNSKYMKALLRRAEAHEKLEHYEEAIADMKKVLELDRSHNQAKKTIDRLEPLAAEKREKMKEEMIGKLKEMGNSILGRFGMSTDNFKAVKDPNTGSYSVQFQR